VEATAYFAISGALTIAARHANTGRARVDVDVQPPGYSW
jgi:hypothetical protein